MGNTATRNNFSEGPSSNSSDEKAKALKAQKCSEHISEFILHDLDFLPEIEKKKQRQKKGPKFLRVDTIDWSASYMRFLGQNQAACETIEITGKGQDKASNSLPDTESTTNDSWFCCPELYEHNDQNDWKVFGNYTYENLVMSGGGSKGYAFIGSLKALEDCGILQKIKRIAGSSAGAICAGLLAVGCSPQEIANVFKCDIKWLFHDQKCVYCCYLPRICHKYYGVHPAKRFYDIYGEHIALKVGNPDITFSELFKKHGCELHIVVTNLSRMCSEYCNAMTCPDIPVRDAVRMSMSFPVVFRAVRYNLNGRECVYTDGGLLDQYPIHCFDAINDNQLEAGASGGFQPASDSMDYINKTLGLYVVAEKALDYKIWQTLFGREIPYKPTYIPNTKLARARLKRELMLKKRQHKTISKEEYINELRESIGDNAIRVLDHYDGFTKGHIDISSFGDYFTATIETLLISQRKMHVKPSDVTRTVPINCGYVGTSDYKIEAGDRSFMICQGYSCTRRFLQDYIMQFKSCSESEIISGRTSCHTAVDKANLIDRMILLKNAPEFQTQSTLTVTGNRKKKTKMSKETGSFETRV